MDEQERLLFQVPPEDNTYEDLRDQLAVQATFIADQNAVICSEKMAKFLSYHLGLLDLGLKVGKDHVQLSHSISPVSINLSSLDARSHHDLKETSLQVLSTLFRKAKKSRTFAFWYILLPNCAFNPCHQGLLELINHPDLIIRERALDLMVDTFQSSSTHLQLANAHCKSGSFTPVCLEFALALGRYLVFS